MVVLPSPFQILMPLWRRLVDTTGVIQRAQEYLFRCASLCPITGQLIFLMPLLYIKPTCRLKLGNTNIKTDWVICAPENNVVCRNPISNIWR